MSTGIVRRLDELGRIVIPKEIRKTMHLNVGDEVDISYDKDGIHLTKYSSIESVQTISKRVAKTLSQTLDCNVLFVSTSKVLVSQGKDRSRYFNATLKEQFIDVVRARKEAILHGDDLQDIFVDIECSCAYLVFDPLVVNGDLLGGAVLLLDTLPSDIARAYLHFCVQLVESVLS